MDGDLPVPDLPGPLIGARDDVAILDRLAVGARDHQVRPVGGASGPRVLDAAGVLAFLLAMLHDK